VASRIETDELQFRALVRFIAEESQRQWNIESITSKAIPLLGDSADPERVENDWIVNFFDKGRLISDDEMQLLWAKILAGEANAPGKFSKRTVNSLASLDSSDAAQFCKLCGTCWYIGEPFPIIVDFMSPILDEHGITEAILFHLEQIGLISMFKGRELYAEGDLPKRVVASYFGESVTLEMSHDAKNELPIGRVILTQVGKELATICPASPIPRYRDATLAYWSRMGVTILPFDPAAFAGSAKRKP
jgi:hypothetical protein